MTKMFTSFHFPVGYENVFFAMLIAQRLTEEGRALLRWTKD